jgi:hypothetical protein
LGAFDAIRCIAIELKLMLVAVRNNWRKSQLAI